MRVQSAEIQAETTTLGELEPGELFETLDGRRGMVGMHSGKARIEAIWAHAPSRSGGDRFQPASMPVRRLPWPMANDPGE